MTITSCSEKLIIGLIPEWLQEFEKEAGYTKRGTRIIYVSGPYSKGDTAENIRNACLAGNEILKRGFTPFVPHLIHLWHLITPKPYQDWLDIDLALISRMDAVLRIPGESKGADNEVALALRLGIPVFYSLDEIQNIAL